MKTLGPFSAQPVVAANQVNPTPPLPFPYAAAFIQSPVAVISGSSYPLNPIEYAMPATARTLVGILGAQIVIQYEDEPGTTFASPQYMLSFQPPENPAEAAGAGLPLVQVINAGLLADGCNKYGFERMNPVWNQLPPWCFEVLGAGWIKALAALRAAI